MSDSGIGCDVCGAFVGHADACPVRLEELTAERDRLIAEVERLREALGRVWTSRDHSHAREISHEAIATRALSQQENE